MAICRSHRLGRALSHPPEVAMALIREAGFQILHHEFLNVPTAGRDKGRFAIVAIALGWQ
jgi:hypothetical protein